MHRKHRRWVLRVSWSGRCVDQDQTAPRNIATIVKTPSELLSTPAHPSAPAYSAPASHEACSYYIVSLSFFHSFILSFFHSFIQIISPISDRDLDLFWDYNWRISSSRRSHTSGYGISSSLPVHGARVSSDTPVSISLP